MTALMATLAIAFVAQPDLLEQQLANWSQTALENFASR